MAKMAKLPQTDWTRGGHEISQTAIPLYKENLTRMGNYLADPMAYQQEYLGRFYNADNIRNQDFLTALKREMGNVTANNWAATTGGYTSAGNRSYNDRQKLWNDFGARLADYGITSSYNMADKDFQNMRGANADYNAAYQLGKNYSAIETQNYLADQYNKNGWANAISAMGAGMAEAGNYAPGPWGAILSAAGGTAMGVGNIFTKDFSGANNAYGAIYGGNPLGGNNTNQTYTNMYKGLSSMFNPQSNFSGGNQGGGMSSGGLWNTTKSNFSLPAFGSSQIGGSGFNPSAGKGLFKL